MLEYYERSDTMFLIFSVEDDKNIAQIINATLSKQGYEVKTFYDGTTFLEELKTRKPDMIMLDMMLPDISGQELIKILRSNPTYDDVEVVIVSANHMLMDKVEGYDLGADDYIEKPFNILELMSIVNAKFRKRKKRTIITVQGITINLENNSVFMNESQIQLTSKEFAILAFLFNNVGNVVKREEIFNAVWGDTGLTETRSLDVHIKALRKKINDTSSSIISTVYGVGYRLNK